MTKQDHDCGNENDYLVQYYGDGKWYLDDDYDIHVPITYCPFCGQIPVPPEKTTEVCSPDYHIVDERELHCRCGQTERVFASLDERQAWMKRYKCPHDVLVATGLEPPAGLSEHALWLSEISVHCKTCGTIFMNFPSDDWVYRIENIPHYPQETCGHPRKYTAFPLTIGARFCLCCGRRWLDFSSPTSRLEIRDASPSVNLHVTGTVYPYHDCRGTPGYPCEICGKTLPKLEVK